MTAEPTNIRIGHVHLRVADLGRAIAFYRDVIGLDVMQTLGTQAAFLSADGYHHHVALNTWDSARGAPPSGHTGLYHSAFLFPSRAALGKAIKRVDAAGIRLVGAADHGVSEAVYLEDPDGNGVELYWDRPREEWPWSGDGTLQMGNDRLDVDAIRAEAG